MNEAARQTRTYLMKLFQQHGFHPRTDLGQNFLIDLNLVEYIVNQGEIETDDVVLEIGAGTGGMTTFLAQHAASVVSVEMDPNMYGIAQKAVQAFSNVRLLNRDALKTKNRLAPELLEVISQELAVSPERRLKLIANLPYNVATPIISNIVATDLPWNRMVVTIQWELGLKITARPESAHYGALAAWIQSQCRAKLLKKIPPTVFWPRPKVYSAIVRIVPNPARAAAIKDRDFFHDFLRRVFHQRRKLLRSVLIGMYRKELAKPDVDALLLKMGLNVQNTRAEELSVNSLVRLANQLHSQVNEAGE